MNKSKKFIFTIDPSGWMRSHESAYLKVISPKGGYKYIYKSRIKADSSDPEYIKFIELLRTKLIGTADCSAESFKVELTLEEAELIFNHAR